MRSAPHRFALALALVLAPIACGTDSQIDRLYDGSVLTDTAAADSAAPVDTLVLPAPRCDTDADCDDGHACTVDRCDLAAAAPHCVWSVAAGACFVNNVCRASGDVRPGDPCARCEPARDALGWSPAADGDACDDHDVCTLETTCAGGSCVAATVLDCEDSEACSADRCDAALGCLHEPVDGVSCDDGLVCTRTDICTAGGCAGAPDGCDDDNPCTADACDEQAGGCVHIDIAAPCEDGDPCTAGDMCAAGACQPGGPNACDDANTCTLDICDGDIGCVHLPTLSPCCTGAVAACDDGNPCTVDLCDPLSGACATALGEGPCDDRDACTVDDRCAAGTCDGAERDCDDQDPCTADSCSSSEGCLHAPLTGPSCDDGLACSTGDACAAGVCLGDTGACVCEPDLGDDGAKLTALAIGNGGYPGEGLDLDGDPATCAPAASCSDGVDNALGILAAFANAPLADAVAAGELVLVALFEPGASADLLTLSLFQAERAPSNPTCPVQTEVCDWLVARDLLDPVSCAPRVSLTGTLVGNLLTATGSAALPFEIRLSADAVIAVTIGRLRVAGTVTKSGGRVTAVSGILAGAVPKEQLIAGINALPAGALPPNLDKATVLALVNALVQNDVDLDGDGVPDAASIGLPFTGIDARIVGATP